MSTKFTKDGKKVSVVGQLNQTEWIVQEIFVTESGDEIPQGEKFTTKTLLDEPVKSWQEKNQEKLIKQADKAKKDLDSIQQQIRDLTAKRRGYVDILKGTESFVELAKHGFDAETLADLATLNYKYALRVDSDKDGIPYQLNTSNYYGEEIESLFINTSKSWGNLKYNGVRSLVIFGDESRSGIKWVVNQHGDSTGYIQSGNIKLFKTKEAMDSFILDMLKNQVKLNKFSESTTKELKANSFEFPDWYKDAYTKWWESTHTKLIDGSIAREKDLQEKRSKELQNIHKLFD